MRSLSKICGRQAFLPRSLDVSFHYNDVEYPMERAGFADVWKGRYRDRDVAVRVHRVNLTGDSIQTMRVSYWRCSQL